MVQHQHADSAVVKEKIGAVEIEKIATLDDVKLENVADESVGEEQLKIESNVSVYEAVTATYDLTLR
jgi:propanediol dehydratase small subunit